MPHGLTDPAPGATIVGAPQRKAPSACFGCFGGSGMSFRPRPTVRLLAVVGSVLMFGILSAAPVAGAIDATYPKQERYALSLVNCLRTGGWVTADGVCIDYGTGKHAPYHKPLKFNE